MSNSRHVIFVVGMHRSGTSAVAGALGLVGAGMPATLIPPAEDNPKGFFESRKVVNLNDRILNAVNASWDRIPFFMKGESQEPARLSEWVNDTFHAEIDRVLQAEFGEVSGPVILKDPRLCLLLPAWEAGIERLGWTFSHVFVVRDPQEVAASLARRNGMPTARAKQLWTRYNADALSCLPEGTPIIRFEAFRHDPAGTLVNAGLAEAEALPDSLRDFVDPVSPASDCESFVRRPARIPLIERIVNSCIGQGSSIASFTEREPRVGQLNRFLLATAENNGDIFRLGQARKSQPIAISGTRKVIFHCHLFKNAGTSVDHVLKSAFGEAWNEQEFPGGTANESNADFVLSHIVANTRFTVFSSHTGNWFLDFNLGPRLQVFPIIFLRHPILRIESAYKFERQQTDVTAGSQLAKEVDLAEYIRTRLDRTADYALTNFQARRLAFFASRDVADIETSAFSAMERLPFIGLVEDFGGSMQRMEAYLKPHFPNFEGFVTQKNVTSDGQSSVDEKLGRIRDQIGDELMERLVAANRIDIELYQQLAASVLAPAIETNHDEPAEEAEPVTNLVD